jgi:predicted DNA-binding transcriptional regulator AlpA
MEPCVRTTPAVRGQALDVPPDTDETNEPIEFLRLDTLCLELKASPATIWRKVAKGEIHKPVHVGPNSTRWLRHKWEADKRAMLARAESAA